MHTKAGREALSSHWFDRFARLGTVAAGFIFFGLYCLLMDIHMQIPNEDSSAG